MYAKARGFQVNTEQRGTNEQQQDKECQTKGQELEKLRVQKSQSAKIFMKLVWKIHEVA